MLLDRTGAPESLWFLAQDYLAHVHSLSVNFQLNWKIPEQVSRGGTPDISHISTPDISHIPMFYWFESVLYLDPVSKMLETTERPGYFVGFAENVGDALTLRILKNTVLNRSVVRSAAAVNHCNKRVLFNSDVQDSLNLVDKWSSFAFKTIHPKFKLRKVHDDVSTRTRSKADYTFQNAGSRTKSQIEFDGLRQIHELDMAEDESDMSWEYSKGLEYCEERGADCSKNQVPKGIKNAIELDKKNGNSLCQDAIKTELKQLTDYQTCIVLDSGEDILTASQKIPYHMVFDVEYDLSHKTRLFAGDNWTVNKKE